MHAPGIWACRVLGGLHEPMINTPNNKFGPKCVVQMKSKICWWATRFWKLFEAWVVFFNVSIIQVQVVVSEFKHKLIPRARKHTHPVRKLELHLYSYT